MFCTYRTSSVRDGATPIVHVSLFIPMQLSVPRPGSSTNFYIAFGGVIIVGCVIIQGLDPGWMDVEIMENLCQVSCGIKPLSPKEADIFFFKIWFYLPMLVTVDWLFLYETDPTQINIHSALWILMPWCFSTRASVPTVLKTHPCVSNCKLVDANF